MYRSTDAGLGSGMSRRLQRAITLQPRSCFSIITSTTDRTGWLRGSIIAGERWECQQLSFSNCLAKSLYICLSVSAEESTVRWEKKNKKHNRNDRSFHTSKVTTAYFKKFKVKVFEIWLLTQLSTNTYTTWWVLLHASSLHAGNQQESLQCNYNILHWLPIDFTHTHSHTVEIHFKKMHFVEVNRKEWLC